MEIKEFFKIHKSVVVALSGGVDSAALLALAKEYADSVYACFVKSEFQPMFELDSTVGICKALNAELKIIHLDMLSDGDISSNPPDRCYYCKKRIFSEILKYASDIGADTVADGTNASDDVADRPGYRALGELGVLSPLRICGIDKAKCRSVAAKKDLPVASKPSYACLATRVPAGTVITQEILHNTESAEKELFRLGFSDFRIRYSNGDARLELTDGDMVKLMNKRDRVLAALEPYYNNILLDLKGR